MNRDLKLIIVEDDDIDFKSISRSLKKEETDIPIVRCFDGAEALEKMHSDDIRHPYIVLLDLNLPVMNGIDFLKAVRESNKTKETVVFVWSTSDLEIDINSSFKYNIAGYFRKNRNSEHTKTIASLIKKYSECSIFPNNNYGC